MKDGATKSLKKHKSRLRQLEHSDTRAFNSISYALPFLVKNLNAENNADARTESDAATERRLFASVCPDPDDVAPLVSASSGDPAPKARPKKKRRKLARMSAVNEAGNLQESVNAAQAKHEEEMLQQRLALEAKFEAERAEHEVAKSELATLKLKKGDQIALFSEIRERLDRQDKDLKNQELKMAQARDEHAKKVAQFQRTEAMCVTQCLLCKAVWKWGEGKPPPSHMICPLPVCIGKMEKISGPNLSEMGQPVPPGWEAESHKKVEISKSVSQTTGQKEQDDKRVVVHIGPNVARMVAVKSSPPLPDPSVLQWQTQDTVQSAQPALSSTTPPWKPAAPSQPPTLAKASVPNPVIANSGPVPVTMPVPTTAAETFGPPSSGEQTGAKNDVKTKNSDKPKSSANKSHAI